MSKVFVLGGTGFLGYYTIKELLSRGYDVKTMSLPPMPDENLFPSEVENELGNMNELSDEEIKELLKDCEGFIYAAGADERTVPPAPALKFFYNANVIPTQRIARLARESGVKTQGYPNTRLLQEQVAEAAVGAMEKGEHRHTYALSGKNMKFQEFYQMMVDALGQTETTQVPVVDYEKMKPMYEELDRQSAEKGVEHGIHMATSSKLQTQDLYIDPEDTKIALGIREHDVIQSIKETLAKCVK